MPNNVNAQAITFANSKVRPAADELISAYRTAKTLISLWAGQNIVGIIPNDANLIQDGATVASGTADGRPPITDAQVNILISNMTSFVNFMEASSNLILNQTLVVNVNGISKI